MESDGVPINPAFYSKEDEYENTIYPILEGKKSSSQKQRRDQNSDAGAYQEDGDGEDDEDKPKKKKSSKKGSLFDDSYGFFISSILAALLGYVIFGNVSIVKFYGNFFSGFYEETSETTATISNRGRIIQIVMLGIFHWMITFWLL